MYLEFDCFERPSLSVRLFETAIIDSYIRIYVNVRGKSFLKALINIYFNKSLKINKAID